MLTQLSATSEAHPFEMIPAQLSKGPRDIMSSAGQSGPSSQESHIKPKPELKDSRQPRAGSGLAF